MSYDIYKEKQEAIDAGRRAIQSLELARDDLSKASTWGMFDMLGGGTLTTFIKRRNMRNGQNHMRDAENDLRAFVRELQDVNINGNLDFEMDDFLSFADYFFDGFFVDFMVQNKIHKAINEIDHAIDSIDRILYQLQ